MPKSKPLGLGRAPRPTQGQSAHSAGPNPEAISVASPSLSFTFFLVAIASSTFPSVLFLQASAGKLLNCFFLLQIFS